MCNLYTQLSNNEAISRLFKVTVDEQPNLPFQPAIFPRMEAPIVRPAPGGGRELAMIHWGFVLELAGRAPRPVTNARYDKVTSSFFWRFSFQGRRCLVPATSFAEPDGRKPATWYWFALAGDQPRPLFSFAGIWTTFEGELRGEAVTMDTFAIITTPAIDVVRPIHKQATPMILATEEARETWISGSPQEAEKLIAPYAGDDLRIVASGDKLDDGSAD